MTTPRFSATVSRRGFFRRLSAAGAFALLPRWGRAADAPAPGKKLGVALVGLGNYSTNQLAPALRASRYCRLAGVVTGSRAKGEKWAREEGFPEANIFGYDTMARMADCHDIDIAYIVTPNGLHAEYCIAAARAGKHVICEKPMAVSVAECDAMIAACRAAGVRLTVGYRLHYEPNNIELCRLARENVFGPFMRIEGDNGFDMGPYVPGTSQWRTDKKLAGGGPLMDMGVYVIQAVCMAKVEAAPVSVTAVLDPVTRPGWFTDVEQGVKWTMEFADGATARCHTSYAEQVSTFRAEARDGWAFFEEPAFYYDTPVLTTSRGTMHLPVVNHQVAQLDGMAAELLAGRPSIAPGEMGRRDVSIIEAIYAAARSGQRVDVKA